MQIRCSRVMRHSHILSVSCKREREREREGMEWCVLLSGPSTKDHPVTTRPAVQPMYNTKRSQLLKCINPSYFILTLVEVNMGVIHLGIMNSGDGKDEGERG